MAELDLEVDRVDCSCHIGQRLQQILAAYNFESVLVVVELLLLPVLVEGEQSSRYVRAPLVENLIHVEDVLSGLELVALSLPQLGSMQGAVHKICPVSTAAILDGILGLILGILDDPLPELIGDLAKGGAVVGLVFDDVLDDGKQRLRGLPECRVIEGNSAVESANEIAGNPQAILCPPPLLPAEDEVAELQILLIVFPVEDRLFLLAEEVDHFSLLLRILRLGMRLHLDQFLILPVDDGQFLIADDVGQQDLLAD